MIEYVSFLLLCILVTLLGASTCYLYSLLKMAEACLNDLLPEVPYHPPESDIKQQKLSECIVTGNCKEYLGKACNEEQMNKLSAY